MSRALDVLVWSPVVSPGGGVRLLLSLLPALARQPEIRSLRLAAPAASLDARAVAELRAEGVAITLHAERGAALPAAGCDVIYAPWPHMRPPLDTDVPLVCTYQDTTLLDFPESGGAEAALRERETASAWLSSSTVVVSSQATAANLSRRFGAAAGGVHLIRHAIAPAPAGGGSPERRLELPPRYLVCPTNASPHKNLDTLLRAWARFERRADWPLVVFGAGTEALRGLTTPMSWRDAQLAGLAERLDLGEQRGVHALGYVPDGAVAPLIAGAAALVMPSHTEGGGSFGVEEALTAGVPVLCADIPAMREHLAERSARIVWFDPESVDSLVAALRELAADHRSLRASAQAGRSDRRPTWDDVAGQYAALFAAIAAAPGTPAGAKSSPA